MKIAIAKTNKDAVTDAIIDMSMTSEANSLKINKEGAWSQAVNPATPYPAPVTIAHNLGYAPCFRVYGQNDPSGYTFFYPNATGSATVTAIVYSDATNLYITLYVGGATSIGTINGYYYIFEDNA